MRVRVDGGFLTGRQVIVAALLGADEYSFGTAAMIAEGCIMLRACHRDTCKPGSPPSGPTCGELHRHPRGRRRLLPVHRRGGAALLATLGLRSIDEAVGRVDLLRQRITRQPSAPMPWTCRRSWARRRRRSAALRRAGGAPGPRADLGDQLLADAFRAIWDGDDVDLSYEIRNADRAIGAALSAPSPSSTASCHPGDRRCGSRAPPARASRFLTHGVELDLTGEANDYVGKGMGGGRWSSSARQPTTAPSCRSWPATPASTARPPASSTSPAAWASASACATPAHVAVVESAGDHCCEYMTGGTIVVTGPVGWNLGAGMTGGQAFVFDSDAERLISRLNPDLVDAVRPDAVARRRCAGWSSGTLRSPARRSALLLDQWAKAVGHVWHVLPKDEVRRIEGRQAGRLVSA